MQVVICNRDFDFASLRADAIDARVVGSVGAVLTKDRLYMFHIDILPPINDVTATRILELAAMGWSAYRIARALDLKRTTVTKHLNRAAT